jgi:hypothetical protein
MKVQFQNESVEVDGVQYSASGAYDTEGTDVQALDIRTPNNLKDHLMDSVIEDILTELVLRYSYKEASDEFYGDVEAFVEVNR